MALQLRVISNHRRPLGERGTMTFGAAGGTIGRSSDNDWVLPDSQRYVSAHHARVRFRSGQFEVEDTSTNGLFVNDDDRPVRQYGPYRLKHGDVLRIGEYEVSVALDPEVGLDDPQSDSWSQSSTLPSVEPVPTRIDALRNLGLAAQTDIGASLNLEELLVAESSSGRRLGPVNAYGQSIKSVRPVSPQSVEPEAPPPSAPGPGEEALARRLARLARAASRSDEARAAHSQPQPEIPGGLEAFCRGAGLDKRLLPADSQARLLQLVGQLLREALVGLKDLERAREAIRSRLHFKLTEDPEDPRPSLVRSTVEDLLVVVLSQVERRQFDAVQWLREAMEAPKLHERAMSEALRIAFVEFVDRFDPSELEARFERAARRAKATGSSESSNWTLFREFYRNLTEMPAGELPHTFLEAFAGAYRRILAAPSER